MRTSDFANWEVKLDPKQSVAEDIYESYCARADVAAGDVLLVRDGTYLVGTSAVVTEHDLPMLFSGGVYRIRVNEPEELDPFLLVLLLNTPIVKRQLRSKQFTRDIIDTIGHRLLEVELPVPRDKKTASQLAMKTRHALQRRSELLEIARAMPDSIEEP